MVNPGSSESGGAVVDCFGHLFLSFATVRGIKIILQVEFPVRFSSKDRISSNLKEA